MAVKTYPSKGDLPYPLPKGSKSVTVGGVKPVSTSADEAKELAKGAAAAKAKIGERARTGIIDPTASREALADVDRITVEGTKPKSTESFWGGLRSAALKQVIGPIGQASALWNGLQQIARTGASAYKEAVVDPAVRRRLEGRGRATSVLSMLNPLELPAELVAKFTTDEPEVRQRLRDLNETSQSSLGDFINQAKDTEWNWRKTAYSQAINERAERTGTKRAKVGAFALDMSVEVVSDPISYVTGIGEVKYIGKAGRLLLVEKFGTTEMLVKYPQLAGKLNEIGRIGVFAIPKEILQAEGISTGLRVIGKVVPKTDEIGRLLGRPLSEIRSGTGALARQLKLGVVLDAFSPASRSVAGSIGRRTLGGEFEIPEAKVRESIASWSARQVAKGETAGEWRISAGRIQPVLEEARKLGLQNRVIELAELKARKPHLWQAASEDERRLAQAFIDWQNDLYKRVGERYKAFGMDFATEVPDFSFLDDYVHHVITPDAKNWLRKQTVSGLQRIGFKTADLNYDELLNVRAPLRFRKLRPPTTLPDGTIHYETFMGQRIEEGTIAEVNRIFREQTGLDIDFFNTSADAIASSYAYSMAKTLGREAYARRLFAFGDDAIKLLREVADVDAELAASLRKGYEGLVAVRNEAMGEASRARESFTKRVTRVIREAEEYVAGKQRALKTTRVDIVKTRRRLLALEKELVAARVVAAGKTADARAGFDVANKALLAEIRELRFVLETGQAEEYAVLKELQDAFVAMFPNAKRIPKNADEIIDKILAAKGMPSSREARAVKARLAEVRKQLDELGSGAELAARREELVSQEAALSELERGFTTLADVRAQADYAPDGLLYGTVDDFIPLADDVLQQTPYRAVRTSPQNLADQADAMATRAMPTSDLLDTRTTDGFRAVFGSDQTAQAVAVALNKAGLNGDVFADGYVAFKATGELSEQFADQYPAHAELIRMIDGLGGVDVGGSGDNSLVMDAVNQFRDMLEEVANLSGRDDITGLALMDDVFGATIFGSGKTGVIVPSNVLDDAADVDAMSVLLDPNWTAPLPKASSGPQDVSHSLGGSTLLQAIVGADFESASLAATTVRNDLEQALFNLGAEEVARGTLEASMRSLRGQAGGMARQAKRRLSGAENARQALLRARGEVEVTLGGKKVRLSRDKVAKELEKRVAQEARLRKNLETTIARMEAQTVGTSGRTVAALERQQVRLGDLLQSLFRQAETLKTWNDETLAVYQREIQNMGAAMAAMPARGEAGASARAWVQRTTRAINNLQTIADPKIREALTRQLTMLHASEVALTTATEAADVAKMSMRAVQTGNWLPQLKRVADEGWVALERLGVQVPEELAGLWRPNLERFVKEASTPAVARIADSVMDYWGRVFKIYATGTIGFIVRNAYSALFMNAVAGVPLSVQREGAVTMLKAAKNPAKWLDEIADPVLRAEYEAAWKATLATSRGFFDDIGEPLTAGSRGEWLVNNMLTRAIGRGNENVERMVRFPMALDVIRKQGNNAAAYTEAVQRVTFYHFDYTDLSTVDRAALKFVPFWIWMSRNIPSQFANQWMRPRAYVMYEKINDALPVDDDTTLPAWMREYDPSGILIGGTQFVIRPDMPYKRLDRAVDQMTRLDRIIGSMYPMYKVPAEWLKGRQLGIDTKPFSDMSGNVAFIEARGLDAALAHTARLSPYFQNDVYKDPDTGKWMISERLSYALGQFFPPVATSQRLSGGALGGKESLSERQWGAIASFLGVPLEKITERQERAELIRRQFELRDLMQDLQRIGVVAQKGEKGEYKEPSKSQRGNLPYKLPKTP